MQLSIERSVTFQSSNIGSNGSEKYKVAIKEVDLRGNTLRRKNRMDTHAHQL